MGHYLLLTTVTAESSEEARQTVYDTLMADDSFVEPSISRSLLFYNPIADYFTIGGRCSGTLSGEERVSEDELGEEDDAQLVTEELYEQFLSQYEGHSSYADEMPEFVDLEDEEVERSFIGRKFIVVVDYHV